MTKRAKTVEQHQIPQIARFAALTSNIPESAELRVLLSCYAGMRSIEIANLRVSDLTDNSGQPAKFIQVSAVKRGKHRMVPMHPLIRNALVRFMKAFPSEEYVSISRYGREGRIRKVSPDANKVWFGWMYRRAGLVGCSSHTGRRTFATEVARNCGQKNASIKDVQDLLGHVQLKSTEAYLESSEDVQDLVTSLGGGTAAPMLGLLERTELAAQMQRLLAGGAA
jgi:integrase/recombinase XerD